MIPLACLGNGPIYAVIQATDNGLGNVRSVTFEYGTTFLVVAGIMNLLLILDIYDLCLGRNRREELEQSAAPAKGKS